MKIFCCDTPFEKIYSQQVCSIAAGSNGIIKGICSLGKIR